MDVWFFMQKIELSFIYYVNRTLSFKINLIASMHNHKALINNTTMYSHLVLDKRQLPFQA